MSASESSGGTVYGLPRRVCDCGNTASLRTSWKNPNCGRRYYSCEQWPNGGCKMFQWAEAEMCQRSQSLIPGLLRKCDDLEAKVAARDEEKKCDEKEISMLKKEKKKLGKENGRLEKKVISLEKANRKLSVCIVILILVLVAMFKAGSGEGKIYPTQRMQLY